VRCTENLPALPTTDTHPFDKRISGQFIEMLRDLDATRPDAWLAAPR